MHVHKRTSEIHKRTRVALATLRPVCYERPAQPVRSVPRGELSSLVPAPRSDPIRQGRKVIMADDDPGNEGAFTLADFGETVRKATLEGMKDYDRERAEWEAAEAAQEKARAESENDKPPKNNSGGLGAFLLGGRKASA